MKFSEDTPWLTRMWYTYSLLAVWLFYDYVVYPIRNFVVNMCYKWKYRKEHREMRKKYKL